MARDLGTWTMDEISDRPKETIEMDEHRETDQIWLILYMF